MIGAEGSKMIRLTIIIRFSLRDANIMTLDPVKAVLFGETQSKISNTHHLSEHSV